MTKQSLHHAVTEARKRHQWTGESPFSCLKEVLAERGQHLNRPLLTEELARLEGWATTSHPDDRQDDDKDRVDLEPLPF